MELLILGGTQLVGRHIIESALEAGHNVTIFNRGKTNPGLYPQVKEIHGDRDGGLDGLKGGQWDAVIDSSGFVPRIVRQSAELLKDVVDRYVFVSTVSVYADPTKTAEDAALATLDDPDTEEVLAHYGGLKVACEKVIREIYSDRALIPRPGFIVGRYDPIARLPWLLQRFDKGGERIAGRAEQPVQVIHSRDLADWMLGGITQKLHGDFNLTGHPFSMESLLNTIVDATGKGTSIIYTGDAFLQEHNVRAIDGITYWLPQVYDELMHIPIQKAVDTGLQEHPLDWIVEDTLAWIRENDLQPDHFGARFKDAHVTLEREAELLQLWHEQANG